MNFHTLIKHTHCKALIKSAGRTTALKKIVIKINTIEYSKSIRLLCNIVFVRAMYKYYLYSFVFNNELFINIEFKMSFCH